MSGHGWVEETARSYRASERAGLCMRLAPLLMAVRYSAPTCRGDTRRPIPMPVKEVVSQI